MPDLWVWQQKKRLKYGVEVWRKVIQVQSWSIVSAQTYDGSFCEVQFRILDVNSILIDQDIM